MNEKPVITYSRSIVLSREALEKILEGALDLPENSRFGWNFRGGQMYDDEPLSVTLTVVHEIDPDSDDSRRPLRPKG